MPDFHGYLLIQRPTALSDAQWLTTLQSLRQVLNKRPSHSQPAFRLHYRMSLSGDAILAEAAFDSDDLSINALAGYIRTALGGAFTLAQVKTALANKVTVFGSGKGWQASRDAASEYLTSNQADWEPEP